MTHRCWTILNGPSSETWRSWQFQGPLFGCNYAYRHFDLTDLCVVDQPVMDVVAQESPSIRTHCRSRGRRYPKHWLASDIPGIDSGSFAIQQAFRLFPLHQHIIIGADGILGGDHATVYDYEFRKKPPSEYAHRLHRQTILRVIEQSPQIDYVFVSERPDKDLRTTDADSIRT